VQVEEGEENEYAEDTFLLFTTSFSEDKLFSDVYGKLFRVYVNLPCFDGCE